MGVVQRKSVRITILLYVGVVLGYLNLLYLFPKFFSAEQIGFFRIIVASPSILIPFLQLGNSQIGLRYFPQYTDQKSRQDLFSFLFSLPLIGFSVFALLFYSNSSYIAELLGYHGEYSEYAWTIPLLVLLFTYNHFFSTYLYNYGRHDISNFLTNIWLRLAQTIGIALYSIGIANFQFVLYFYMSAFLVQAVVLAVELKWVSKMRLLPSLAFLKYNKIKEVLTYGGFSLLGSGGGFLIQRIDIVMTASMLDLSNAGKYAIAFFIGNVIEMPRRAISQVLLPIISQRLKEGNMIEVEKLYYRSSLIQMILAGVAFLLIWLNIDELFLIMPNGEKFVVGKYAVLFIGLAKFYDLSWGINSEMLTLSKFYKNNLLIMAFLAVFTVFNNYLLIPEYQITGTAIATFITVIAVNSIRGVIVYNKFKMHPFRYNHLKVMMVLVICFVVVSLFNVNAHPILSVLIKSIVIMLLTIGPIYYLKLSEDFNKMINGALSKVFGRDNK